MENCALFLLRGFKPDGRAAVSAKNFEVSECRDTNNGLQSFEAKLR